ncbi:MAG TPA: hypothetical protein VL308_15565 [Gemmatimonadaceae bacterium]|jgi:Protein of unknown function (DUF2938).|nr:hypothetical protein [Gemmatimonadaceae bacterium]
MRRLALGTRTDLPVPSRLWDIVAVRLSGSHDALREGTALGIVLATGIWVWLAAVDALAGQPFHTFSVLGGITAFTIVHYLLNIAYGVVVVSAVHGATREPSLAIAVVFGVVTLEIAFAMVTVLLSNLGLGARAWVGIFGGSLIGTGLCLFLLSRRHSLVALVREADSQHAAR